VFVNGTTYQAGQRDGQAAIAIYSQQQQQPQIRYIPQLTSLTSIVYNNTDLIVSGIQAAYDYYIAYSSDNAISWKIQNLNANIALNMKYISAVRKIGDQAVIVGKTNDIVNNNYTYVVRIDDISNSLYTRDTIYDFKAYPYATNSFFKFIDIASDNRGNTVAIGPDFLTGVGKIPIAIMVNTGIGGWILINVQTPTTLSKSGSIRVFYDPQQSQWVIQSDSYTYTKAASVLTNSVVEWTLIGLDTFAVCPGYYVMPTRSLYFNAKTDVATQIIEKTTGSFEIPHTDPVKAAEGQWLRHCFIEAPTRGENIYRYTVQGPLAIINLPEYFEALNENVQAFVNAENAMTDVWTDSYDPTTNTIRVYSHSPATLNVLVVGTRRDPAAHKAFDDRGGVVYKA